MKKKILIFQIIAIIFSIALGTILHFTYEWSGNNQIVASFSAINESTWEHLKLAFFPMLIIAIIEYFFIGKEANNYIESKAIAILFAITFITVAFYTYTGITGESLGLVNILIFIFSIIIAEILAYKKMLSKDTSTNESKIFSILVIIFFLICFVQFTYITPSLNIFKSPV